MNLNLFIAKKITGKGETKRQVSSLSNKIATISVIISIVVMFIAIAVTDGFKKEISEKAMGFSGEIVFTTLGQDVLNDQYPIDGNLSYLSLVKKLGGVKDLEWVAYKAGMLKTENNVQGIFFKGVDSLYDFSFYERHLVDGSIPNFKGTTISNEIIISQRLANLLGYEVGDDMLAYFVGEKVRVRKFKVAALYSAQLEEVDMTLAVVDIRHVQRLNEWKSNEYSACEIYLENHRDRSKIIGDIDIIVMDNSSDSDSPIAVKGIDDLYPNLFDWLEILNLNVLVILILMIVVAGFNMISGLLIILFERISMIGLLKAMGMTNRSICSIFIYRGSFIILRGMILGNIVAILLCAIQGYFHIFKLDPANYFVSYIPIHIDIPSILLLNIVSFILMMIILILPSLFIAKIQPDKTIKIR
jgi:lipoprotein-releasing system permease protein